MADQDIISTQIFQAKDLSFKSVTVYEDQAEVHRKLVLTLQQGLNRIQVENLPPKLDSETFRVDGHGSATIHEVQFKNRGWQEKKDEDSEELKELKKQIKELEEKKSKINVSLNTYVKHLKALDSLTTNVLKFSTSDVEKQPKLFDDAAEASLEKLFGYHEKKSSEIGIKGCQYEKEIKEIDEEIAKIKSKISQSQSNMVNKKSVVILLEATQADAKIELDITYQSKNASWKSSYDFRVRTNGKSEENKLQLVYFGNIQQSTGEDWKDTELILSTGQLKSAGSLPTITQLNAKFKSQSRRPVPPSCTFGGKPTAPFNFGTTQPATNQAPVLFGARASSQATSTSATFGAGQSSQNTGVNASTDQIEQPPTPPSVEFSNS
uniref:DUF4139 domain-containing protein n=1 Tax=Acrobeloides nanus TaxID=290746 RepID=A0A914CY07_9BILA